MFGHRKNNYLLSIIASPFFLALPFSLAIIWFLPNPDSKFKAEFIGEELIDKPAASVQFSDLNGDEVDEQVLSFHNSINSEAAIKVLNSEGLTLDQWNFNGYFPTQPEYFYCADLDNNGYKEIYVFYFKEDSVFLGAVQPYPEAIWLFNKKLITTVTIRNNKIDYFVYDVQSFDIDRDGTKELIFILDAGFSRQPRGVFIFDQQKDLMIHSPSFGAYLLDCLVNDLNQDSIPEIYCGSSATANILKSFDIPYNDHSSWFIGMDNKLELLFPPQENPGITSGVSVSKFKSDGGKPFVVTGWKIPEEYKAKMAFHEANGKEFKSKTFEFTPEEWKQMRLYNIPYELKGKHYLFIGLIDGYFVFTDQDFKLLRIKTSLSKVSLYLKCDLNNDGREEALFITENGEEIIISDPDLKHFVRVPTHLKADNRVTLESGIRHNVHNQNELFLHAYDNLYFYSYQANPLYYLKYPLWLLIYGLVVLILWVAQRLQTMQTQRKQQMEETINSLQMRVIKSQMDPHFMFNVLNGLAHNVAIGNTTEAHDQIIRVSKLLRSMMSKGEKVDAPLVSELDFVKSYLELEKFRFKDDFNFLLQVGPSVDLNTRIPRMLIQLLVENAIKHGLRNKPDNKRILIKAETRNAKTILIVEDNGIGRKAAKEYQRESGNGMKIMSDMILLNSKITGNTIRVTTSDLYDNEGKASGTRVEVEV
ncbi:MAG: hypothetical protein A2W85_18535 [Bacteroidetes bacterium GWF2_41_31]|nr:MAG: hypothetical protein A2W85_18535 [Bacteroidetes bacterium GWF2_41_31]